MTHEGEDRFVEIDRRAPSIAQVQGQINRKFGITGQTTLTFLLPSGTSIPVNNDNDLRRAITETAMTGEYYVNLTVRGGYKAGGQARPQTQQQAPVSQPRPAQTHQPASAAMRQPAPASHGMLCHCVSHTFSSRCYFIIHLAWCWWRWSCKVQPSRSWCTCSLYNISYSPFAERLSLPTFHCWY